MSRHDTVRHAEQLRRDIATYRRLGRWEIVDRLSAELAALELELVTRTASYRVSRGGGAPMYRGGNGVGWLEGE